jgi:hypothetical protein
MQFYPMLFAVAIGLVPINVLVFCNHQHLSKILIIWSVLTNLALAAISIILAIKLPWLGVTLSIYGTNVVYLAMA